MRRRRADPSLLRCAGRGLPELRSPSSGEAGVRSEARAMPKRHVRYRGAAARSGGSSDQQQARPVGSSRRRAARRKPCAPIGARAPASACALEQTREDQRPALGQRHADVGRQLDQRPGKDIGDDQVIGRARRSAGDASIPAATASASSPAPPPSATPLIAGIVARHVDRARDRCPTRWHRRAATDASRRRQAARCPVPRSSRLRDHAPARFSVSSMRRQPLVVSCVPVPNASPASIRNGMRARGHRALVGRRYGR